MKISLARLNHLKTYTHTILLSNNEKHGFFKFSTQTCNDYP